MADNIAVTPGSGATIATDDIGGVHYPYSKMAHGADGSVSPVSSSDPLPVNDASQKATNFKAATLSDSTAQNPTPKALYIGGAGNVAVKGANGVTAVFACQAGQILPISPTHIMATNTTATGIVVLH